MKWWKHMSDMSISDRGKYVLSKFGSVGYAWWCLILEMIAQAMDRNKPNVCYREMPINEWCKSLKVNRRRLIGFLTDVGKKLNLDWEIVENMLKVEAPEMLKLVDDSTKKAQVAKRHSVIVTEQDKDKDEYEDKNKDEGIGFDVESSFEEIWGKYLNKDGKKKAKEHFISSVKNEDAFRKINLALENYKKSDAVKKGYIKSGGNWFADWESWVDYKNVSEVMSEIQKEKEEKQMEEQRNMLNSSTTGGVPMPDEVRQRMKETMEKLKNKSEGLK